MESWNPAHRGRILAKIPGIWEMKRRNGQKGLFLPIEFFGGFPLFQHSIIPIFHVF